ncbi:MAG TPA: hypothetical protein VI731_10730 [Bacteroidia bacterium]|nr:hypothetical protein [Bacteroidia bacterium]
MRPILLLLFCLGAASMMAQQKFQLLAANDPLVGEWEWVKNDTTAMFTPFTGENWMYLSFGAGPVQSFGSPAFSEEKGYGAASYFLAFSNGSTITATLSDSPVPENRGKKFSFSYVCDKSRLIITYNDEQFIYRRKN